MVETSDGKGYRRGKAVCGERAGRFRRFGVEAWALMAATGRARSDSPPAGRPPDEAAARAHGRARDAGVGGALPDFSRISCHACRRSPEPARCARPRPGGRSASSWRSSCMATGMVARVRPRPVRGARLVRGRSGVLAPRRARLGGGALLLSQLMPTRRLYVPEGCACSRPSHSPGGGNARREQRTAAHGPPLSSGARRSCRPTGGSSVRALLGGPPHVQTVGVDILVVFFDARGCRALTGASLARVLRATGNGLVDTSRVLRGPC